MPYEFHKDRTAYFHMQTENAHAYVIPFIEQSLPITKGMNVLEVGCGEGGVLKAFVQRGCKGVGVELTEVKYKKAFTMLAEFVEDGSVQLINKNIYDVDPEKEMGTRFDLIVLKDVIEHIPDQAKIMQEFHRFLKPGGHIYFGFPPWQMPFGGHQQMCKSILRKVPYIHLLPGPLYPMLLRAFGEKERAIEHLLYNKKTGISLERFERICKQTNYEIVEKTLYLFNPIYKYKFDLEPREKLPILGSVYYLKNFVTTCGYYLIQSKN